jgi:hypothetical protein
MDQMHLPQVRDARVLRLARQVLHRHAKMRIALDAQPGDQPNPVAARLAETVSLSAATAVTRAPVSVA